MDIDWKNIFYNEYEPSLNKLKELVDNDDKFYDYLPKTVRIAINLLIGYMAFSGIYPPNELVAIKMAYYNEILSDGRTWINMYLLPSMKFILNKSDIMRELCQFEQYLTEEIKYYYA